MSESPDRQDPQNPEEEIWSAISSFEQILEVLPDDRTSLRTLSSAYEQIGDHARAKDFLFRLSEVLLKEADYGAAFSLIDKLRAYVEYDAGVGELIARIEEHGDGKMVDGAGGARQELPAGKVTSMELSLSKFSIAAEMSMAWNLMEAGELTQDEYALVVQDLTEMSGQQGGTASALHVLEAHGGMNLERIMTFLSKECNTPILSLENFEFNLEAIRLLSRDFMVARGCLVFELLGTDALVVLLNPYDAEIRKDVKALLGRECHFYMVLPSEFDRRIERLDDVMDESSQ